MVDTTSNSKEVESVIKLNVGGTLFTTTRETLESNGPNFFTGLLSGRIPAKRDETGAYFIDREGKYFRCLLDFLRTGELSSTKPQIIREAAFFGIELPNLLSSVGRTPAPLENTFINDDWLQKRYLLSSYDYHRPLSDNLIDVVIEKFRFCVDNRLWPPEVAFRGPLDEEALRQTLTRHGVREDTIGGITAIVKIQYSERLHDQQICPDEKLFHFLNTHRSLFIAYCKMHGLSVEVLDGHGVGRNSLQFDYASLRVGFPPTEFRDAISHSFFATRTRPAWPEILVRGAIGLGTLS